MVPAQGRVDLHAKSCEEVRTQAFIKIKQKDEVMQLCN
jgi:hypothetical protein